MSNKSVRVLLTKYYAGEITPEEKVTLDRWVNDRPENSQLLAEFETVWNTSNTTGVLPGWDTEEEWNIFENKLLTDLQAEKKRKRFRFITAAACIAALLIAFGLFYMNSSEVKHHYITFETSGKIKKVILPDGSIVWINNGGKLSYDAATFNKTDRILKLEGEAFFDVSHDKSKPFLVYSKDLTVRVTGTSFNMRSYTTEDKAEVLVVTGRVEVYEREQSVALKRGDKVTVKDKSHLLTTSKTNDFEELAWITGAKERRLSWEKCKRKPQAAIVVPQDSVSQIAIEDEIVVTPPKGNITADAIKSPKSVYNFLEHEYHTRENLLQQTIAEGIITNNSANIYKDIKIRVEYYNNKNERTRISHFQIRKTIKPKETISYKEFLGDVFNTGTSVKLCIVLAKEGKK